MKKKKTNTFFVFGAALVVVVLAVLAFQGKASLSESSASLSSNVKASPGNAQQVKLTMQGYKYILNPQVLEVGVPVRMEVDMNTVYGCMRDITIPAFGVRKQVSEQDNIIEFTPTKAGTFNIACSMNMGRGTFTVVESDGSQSSYVESTPAPTGTCGASGGGCGCGAR